MITFTQMKDQAAANTGLYSDDPKMAKVIRDINTGVKLFQNAARRYWTRRERKTRLIAGKQFYQFPSDMLRVSSVKIKSGNGYVPITEVKSEDQWNRMTSGGFFGSGIPTSYFVKGADEIGLFPTPSSEVVDGLLVVFEPRMPDMAIEDAKVNVNLVRNSNIITADTDVFTQKLVNNCYITITDGSDGNWYKVIKFINARSVQIENYYQGYDANNVEVLIGQCPQFPEEYHDAPVYFACQQFYTMRKDLESASFYKQMYDNLYNEYRRVYGNKTTGGVINPHSGNSGMDPFAGLIIT